MHRIRSSKKPKELYSSIAWLNTHGFCNPKLIKIIYHPRSYDYDNPYACGIVIIHLRSFLLNACTQTPGCNLLPSSSSSFLQYRRCLRLNMGWRGRLGGGYAPPITWRQTSGKLWWTLRRRLQERQETLTQCNWLLVLITVYVLW